MGHTTLVMGYGVASLLAALLIATLGVLIWLWDARHAGPRRVTRRVWCRRFHRMADVEFLERVETGWTVRVVDHCPLRDQLRATGRCCGEHCVLQPALHPRPTAAAAG